MTLVRIPWQPDLYVHEHMLAKLEQIRERRGAPPYLYGSRSGWRSYADQKALWDAYRKGGNIASNPDSGNRTHMRGVAADLRDTSAAMQRACIAVGLQRDPAEAWHWQLPNWRDYPVIPSRASLSETPNYVPEEDDEMKLIKRSEGATEASLFHPSFHGDSDKERGYYVITDLNEIVDWERILYPGGAGSAKEEPRSVYVRMQQSARIAHSNVSCARCTPAAGGTVDIQPIVSRLDSIAVDMNKPWQVTR